jgi:hypothetical protein
MTQPGPQKAQMTQTPFDFDTAIDAVAKQLTRVEPDPHLSARIAASLPDRSPWALGWWAPRLAALAIVVAAGIVWGNGTEQVSTPTASPLVSTQSANSPIALMASVREAEPNRTRPLEPVEPLEPLHLVSDFDRALPAIEALASLELDALSPASLPEDAPLTVAPLAMTDLALTPDPVFQQE